MRVIFVLVLMLGLLLAGAAVFMVSSQINSYETALAEARSQLANSTPIETVDVIVATETLRSGDILRGDTLRLVKWPADSAPEGAFATGPELFGEGDDREERVVLRMIDPNEPITRTKITGFGQDAGMASRLAPGYRAFTIRVDVASGVSGFLTPGDRVDVFWTGTQGNRESVTRLILENLRLIGVDQTSNEDRSRAVIARTITVEALPEEAAVLAQADATGELSLSLRGIADTSNRGILEVDQADILGVEEVEEVVEEVVEEAPQRTITIRRAGEVQIVPSPPAD